MKDLTVRNKITAFIVHQTPRSRLLAPLRMESPQLTIPPLGGLSAVSDHLFLSGRKASLCIHVDLHLFSFECTWRKSVQQTLAAPREVQVEQCAHDMMSSERASLLMHHLEDDGNACVYARRLDRTLAGSQEKQGLPGLLHSMRGVSEL